MLDSRHFIIKTFQAEGVVREADIRRATEHAVVAGGDVLDSMVTLGMVSARRLAITRAKIFEYPFVDLSHYEVDIRNTKLMPRSMAERLTVFPLFVVEDTATVAMLDPLNVQAIDQVRQVLKTDVDPVLVDADQLRLLIARAYSVAQPENGEDAPIQAGGDELTVGNEPSVASVHQIIAGGMEAGASDIHLNPDEHDVFLRYRVDGVLVPRQSPARSAYGGIVQRLRALAKLDQTQTRRPQDGTFRFIHRGARGEEPVDIRLSLIPTVHGESAVMRFMPASTRAHLAGLGMPERMVTWCVEALEHSRGMILVAGPAGSGRTTTLYAALNHFNNPARNIITVEDPVEAMLPHVRQVQVDPGSGMTLAGALHAALRQDPDVVLVGAIRDEQTAGAAVQAAMSGRLVLSTLNGNDAVGALDSLRDFGVPARAINNTLRCVIGQRLVRRLCDACAAPENNAGLIASLPVQWQSRQYKRAVGCAACGSTGYRGRLGVFEMLRMVPAIQAQIALNVTGAGLSAPARAAGLAPMWEECLEKASRGLTSLAEVARTGGPCEAQSHGSEQSRAAA